MPAAIGLAQLELVEEFVSNRREYCRDYDAAFADLAEAGHLQLFDTDWEGVAPYIYVLRVRDPSRRAALVEHLAERGIASGIHYYGAHQYSFYEDCRRGDLSVTELAAQQVLTLPLHPYMEDGVLDRVVEGVRSFFA